MQITEQQAAVLYAALEKPVAVVDELKGRKASAPFAVALKIEADAYKAEQRKLAEAFPAMVNAAA